MNEPSEGVRSRRAREDDHPDVGHDVVGIAVAAERRADALARLTEEQRGEPRHEPGDALAIVLDRLLDVERRQVVPRRSVVWRVPSWPHGAAVASGADLHSGRAFRGGPVNNRDGARHASTEATSRLLERTSSSCSSPTGSAAPSGARMTYQRRYPGCEELIASEYRRLDARRSARRLPRAARARRRRRPGQRATRRRRGTSESTGSSASSAAARRERSTSRRTRASTGASRSRCSRRRGRARTRWCGASSSRPRRSRAWIPGLATVHDVGVAARAPLLRDALRRGPDVRARARRARRRAAAGSRGGRAVTSRSIEKAARALHAAHEAGLAPSRRQARATS